jgi:3-dehydroquinate dehydratase type I
LKPRICVSVKTDDLEKVRKAIKYSQRLGAGFVELRLDYVKEGFFDDLASVVENSRISCIATIRPAWDGGAYRGGESDRLRLFQRVLEAPFKYVDIEHDSKIVRSVSKLAREKDVGLIVSYHDWKGTPGLKSLEKILWEMRRRKADICKIVTTITNHVDEAKILFFLLTSARSVREKLVCFGMGEKGIATRIVSPLLGGFMTYASYEEALAPGQITLREIVLTYRSMGLW